MIKATRRDILNALGLDIRHSPVEYVVPAAGILGAGILLGVGVGLLLAPKPGRRLREDIGGRITTGRDVLRQKGEVLRQRMRSGATTETTGVGGTQTQGTPIAGQDILHS